MTEMRQKVPLPEYGGRAVVACVDMDALLQKSPSASKQFFFFGVRHDAQYWGCCLQLVKEEQITVSEKNIAM